MIVGTSTRRFHAAIATITAVIAILSSTSRPQVVDASACHDQSEPASASAVPAMISARTDQNATTEKRPRIAAVERTCAADREASTIERPTSPPNHAAAAVACTASAPMNSQEGSSADA